jgi:hypothetical protein
MLKTVTDGRKQPVSFDALFLAETDRKLTRQNQPVSPSENREKRNGYYDVTLSRVVSETIVGEGGLSVPSDGRF